MPQSLPLITRGCSTYTPKLCLPLWRSPSQSNTPFTHRPYPPPQTASRSKQPCCHGTQKDRPTDGIGKNSVPTPNYVRLSV